MSTLASMKVCVCQNEEIVPDSYGDVYDNDNSRMA